MHRNKPKHLSNAELITILMVEAHKRESQQILRIVKEEDEKAFMTMNTVMGAYGKGFEQIRK
ncbi:MAG: DUF2179 domain-containing protein [Candidatus Limimorpha sp.]